MGLFQRLGVALSAFIAFAIGLITLLSLLLGDNPELFGGRAGAEVLAGMLAIPADVLLRLVAIIAALGIVIGVANLLTVHVGRLARRRGFSAVLLASFAFTIYWYVTRPGDTALLEAVQVPIESSLAALLSVTLILGGARILSKRSDIWGLLFLAVALFVLVASLPLAELEPLQPWRDWLMRVAVSAGARALLLGVALGAVVAGTRALLGQDRAYRG